MTPYTVHYFLRKGIEGLRVPTCVCITFLLSFENHSLNVFCPSQNWTMAQYFSQLFPKPGRNVFTLLCMSAVRIGNGIFWFFCNFRPPFDHPSANRCTGMVKKICSMLRELSPAARGGEDAESRNLAAPFLTIPIHTTDGAELSFHPNPHSHPELLRPRGK